MSKERPIEIGFRRPPDTPRPGPTVRATTTRVEDGAAVERADTLATEEPLEIRVQHRGAEHITGVTMRTPTGHDFELAVGALFAEGMLRSREDLAGVSYCASGPPEQLYNIVTVELRDAAPFDPEPLRRSTYTNSACGVCGKASLDAIRSRFPALGPGPRVPAAVIEALPDALRERQKVFARTGGLHAAGLFAPDGAVRLVREDVGRHNAVDKLAGRLLLDGEVPAGDAILQVSGRASFELVQKAVAAGIAVMSAVGAPSSLAVSLASEAGMTLIGFAQRGSFNVYSAAERVTAG